MCKHMTVEELNSLNPSFEKPVTIHKIRPNRLDEGYNSLTVISKVVDNTMVTLGIGKLPKCTYNVSDYLKDYKSFKQPKKIKLFRYTYKFNEDTIFQSGWSTASFVKIYSGHYFTLLKTEEKEIEVD